MAFIAPLIGAALGLGTFATGVLGVGLAVGLGFAANRLTGSQSTRPAKPPRGRQVSLEIATDKPRRVLFGQQGVAGSLEYWQLYGEDNSNLQMVISLADHECDGLAGVWVNGKYKTIAENGDVAGFSGKLNIEFHAGTSTQTASASVVANSGGRWTSNERGLNVCYVVVTLEYDEQLFPEPPQLVFDLRGYCNLYNPASGGTGYSDNSAIILYNILRGISPGGEPLIGMNVPADAIRSSDVVAAIAACNELINRGAGGTEKRYRCNVEFSTDDDNRAIIETVLRSMAGDLIETGGIYRIIAGVSRASVAALTDADLITKRPFVVDPKRPRSALVNAITGSYSDPSRAYAMVALPSRTSSTDETIDGGIRLARDLDLRAVTSRTQAQRLMEIERKKARRQTVISGTYRHLHCRLEPGDWVTISSDRRGFTDRTMEVTAARQAEDCTVELDFAEVDSAVDDWSTSEEIADNEVADLASGGPVVNELASFAVATVSVSSGGVATRPGIRATWTPVTDPTITDIKIEYRRPGDTSPLKYTVLDPSEGQATWITGVQGGTTYEVRARMVSRPARAMEWTGWASTASATAPQVVEVAALANGVPPGTIGADELDAQSRYELSLTTAADEVLGSLSASVTDVIQQVSDLSEAAITGLKIGTSARAAVRVEKTERLTADSALASQITEAVAQIGETSAQVTSFMSAQSSTNSATATLIETLTTELNGQAASVAVIATSINGIEGRIGLALNINGHVTGLVQLDGTAAGSTLTIVSDALRIARPDIAGGAPVPVFALQTVAGVTRLALRGDLIADGTISARHINGTTLSVLAADLGTIIAGVIRNASNTVRFDVAQMRIYRPDGKFNLDMDALIFEMGS